MQRRKKQQPIKFTLRFYPGQDDDLIQWLDRLDEKLVGIKAQTMKEVLRQGLGSEPGQTLPGASSLDLAEVRRVVEAGVASVLGQWDGQGGIGARDTPPEEQDDEVEYLLAALHNSLVVGDDG